MIAMSSRQPPACAAPDVIAAAQAHALADFPREAVGIIDRAGAYQRLANQAADRDDFAVAPGAAAGAVALIHSHTNGNAAPSERDMRQQIATAIPWGIIMTDGQTAAAPFWWGDMLGSVPLLGREWRSGITDCVSLVRDWFQAERGVLLPEMPREPDWARAHGAALAGAGFVRFGFGRVPAAEASTGDVLVIRMAGAPAPHHVAVLLDGQDVIHHLTGDLSRREPLGRWARFVTGVLRHGA